MMGSMRGVVSPYAAEAEWDLKAVAFRMSGMLMGGDGGSQGKSWEGRKA